MIKIRHHINIYYETQNIYIKIIIIWTSLIIFNFVYNTKHRDDEAESCTTDTLPAET